MTTVNPNITGKKTADNTVDDAKWERPVDTARIMGVARSTVYAAIAKGELDAHKWQGCTLISVASRKRLSGNLPKSAYHGGIPAGSAQNCSLERVAPPAIRPTASGTVSPSCGVRAWATP